MQYATIDPNGNRCTSSVPYCGYPYNTLKDMAEHGYTLEINGKPAKFPTKTEHAQATQAKAKTPAKR